MQNYFCYLKTACDFFKLTSKAAKKIYHDLTYTENCGLSSSGQTKKITLLDFAIKNVCINLQLI
jgi:hypothetical protein